jgi:valyl-tRNA synthetase
VPIIFDEYVDKAFGTGALKVTPAHDINDYNLGIKHKLETIDTLNPDGTLSDAAGFYIGEDRFAVRKKIAKDLEELGYLVKSEDIKNKVGTSERTGAVIEPKLSLQWFLKMDQVSKPALDAVLNGEVKLIPDKFINTYKHWMENVHDWCISRQLWWGQRIPAWYNKQNEYVVCRTSDEAIKIFAEKGIIVSASELRQDEDVLDTWFSSWLWPISVFDGFKNPNNADIKYYYPTNDLVTAPEILFFWVARMIIAGYEWMEAKPFTNVYLTGIVRDKLGRKMSKSLGNSPDPLDLIAKYGADGVRVGMLLSSPAGNDLLFDESYCEQGRNFTNKVWNAFRLIKGWNVDEAATTPETNKSAVNWFHNKFNKQLAEINDHYSKYRMSDALMSTYKLVWDDFCAWYLEMVKPGFEQPIDKWTYDKTISILENVLKVMHPYMPFITEEIYHLIKERSTRDCVIVAQWPLVEDINESVINETDVALELITSIRNFRSQKGKSPKEALELFAGSNANLSGGTIELVKKLANVSAYHLGVNKPEPSFGILIKSAEFFIPVSFDNMDKEAEIERLNKELEYNKGFLKSVQSKLANERFVSNAKPEIIENERKKQADAEAKIQSLMDQLSAL